MNLQEFISKFASQFEDEDPSVLQLIPIIMSWIHGHHLQA